MRDIVVGTDNSVILNFIKSNGYDVIISKNSISNELNYHIDLALLKIDDYTFIISDDQKDVINAINQKGYNVYIINMPKNAVYPLDCTLNHVVMKNIVIGAKRALSGEIKAIFDSHNKTIVYTKQGYAKCSTIVINNQYIITDDITIKSASDLMSIENILISKGDIKLDGFEYGFIGGASFVDDQKKIVYFFGDITNHRDYDNINSFIKEIGYDMRYIPGYPLTDIGGAVII